LCVRPSSHIVKVLLVFGRRIDAEKNYTTTNISEFYTQETYLRWHIRHPTLADNKREDPEIVYKTLQPQFKNIFKKIVLYNLPDIILVSISNSFTVIINSDII
jgi:hypothetical protein